MKISVRESKLVVERLLLLTGLDRRMVPKVRDFIVASELVGSGALQFFKDEMLEIEDLETPRLQVVSDSPERVVIDCGGQFAPVIGPVVLNLMSARASRDGALAIQLQNVRHPRLLNGLVPLANRRGLVSFVVAGGSVDPETIAIGSGTPVSRAQVSRSEGANGESRESPGNGLNTHDDESSGTSCLILVASRDHTDTPEREDDEALGSEMTRALHEGIEVDEDLWWTLYHRSNDALTPTSEISRTHAGPSVDKLFVEF